MLPPPLEAGISNVSSLNLENRHSHGLDQFCASLEERPGLSILDLAGASQSTVSFVTNYGHRLYSDDFVHQLDACFGEGDFYDNQTNPRKVEQFLEGALTFEDGSFDGVLVWDVLEYLSPPLLSATVDRLCRIVKPGSYLLAVFQAQEKAESVPEYSFRIQDSKTLLVADRGRRKPEQVFNNLSLEKLFQNFESLKFFLARDKLREVIVRR
jgi:hypothetical protein